MGFSQAVRTIKSIWNHGDEEDYDTDATDEHEPADEPGHNLNGDNYDKPSVASTYTPTFNGSGSGGNNGRRLRPVPLTLRAREKNIYTLRPKTQDEAAIAADYLKTGSAVVLNLETVDRMNAVRIIDFMSGVCYGLDAQGHAMKLGDKIFLFTPGDFELTSDETDYGENPECFFKDVAADGPTSLGLSSAGVHIEAAYVPDRPRWES